ncbi:MAG: ba3-type cytochrome C oxidase subunit II [Candidatus Promineifilaceae bacterium]
MMHVDRREKIYIIFSIIMLVTFATTLGVSAFVSGFQVPQPVEVVDPRTVATPGVSPFGDPVEERVRELAPNRYEAYILAQTWSFLPREIRVPVGSTVTFYVTSKDVQHGFILEKTNINMMVLPGHISKLTATFDEPGTYNFVCDEYCGVGHHTMYGQLIVEE